MSLPDLHLAVLLQVGSSCFLTFEMARSFFLFFTPNQFPRKIPFQYASEAMPLSSPVREQFSNLATVDSGALLDTGFFFFSLF